MTMQNIQGNQQGIIDKCKGMYRDLRYQFLRCTAMNPVRKSATFAGMADQILCYQEKKIIE